ncbi:hypothetical protein TWF730_005384 [Orbilia blumenaviensis]|uniref:Uncharacterized protein n=1 Tax=Orbilia blumenaviensis TaxID=1796055 RepID=A0AAV9VPE1_9PEZI
MNPTPAPSNETPDIVPAAAAEEEFSISPEDDRLFLSLENYCWEDDPEFQSGLTEILSNTTDPTQVRFLTRQAKCYFYSRKISRPILFPLYQTWLHREERSGPRRRSPSSEVGPPLDPTPIEAVGESNPSIPSDTPTTDKTATAGVLGTGGGDDDKVPYPTSFAHIVELITSGKPVPGIREIPNTLNAAPPTQSSAQQRRKPWEVLAAPENSNGANSLPSPSPTPES